jgi:uncharacterized protein YndB with AHSA1/START domain
MNPPLPSYPREDAPSDRDFVISRVFAAPRELVWRAWTDPAHLSRWWGPAEFTNPVCEMDLRPGGAYRIVMRSPEGNEYPLTGNCVEVVPPERLVLTMDTSGHPDSWHKLINPHHKTGENAAGPMVQTIMFENVDGKTKVTVRTRFESSTIRDGMLKVGMNEGWSQSLDRLGDVLGRMS